MNLQTAGTSLFTGKVTVLDSTGKVMAAAVATDPLGGNVNITVLNPRNDAVYAIKVQGGTADAFAVGGYQLSARVQDPSAPPPAVVPPTVPPVAGLTGNTTYGHAADLNPTVMDANGKLTGYAVATSLSAAGETDYYKITAPDTAAPMTMLVRVLGLDATALAGRLSVFTGDAGHQTPVAFQVLVNANGLLSIQVDNAVRKMNYTVAVSAQAGSPVATGNYRLAVDFVAPQAATMQNFSGGTLTARPPRNRAR